MTATSEINEITTPLDPPGPPKRLPLGINYPVEMGLDVIGFLKKVASYGDVAHFKVAKQHVYLFNHPDYVRDILVAHQKSFNKGAYLDWLRLLVGNGLLTSEGDFWLRQRRMIQPAFHRKRIASYGKIMTDYSEQWQAKWQDGQTLNIYEEMVSLTLAIVARCLFDADTTRDKNIHNALEAMRDWSSRAVLPRFIAHAMEKLPLPTTARFHKAQKYFDDTIYELIKERRASGEDKGDLLSMLLKAQDEEVAGEAGRMTDSQIHDEILTFFLAGHETTALTLTWMWYLLSQHPAVEAKFQAELDEVLQGRVPTFEDMPNLVYTEKIMTETLRLYPAAYVVPRTVIQEIKLGDYTLPVGSRAVVAPYLLQRDPRYFPDPEKFDPDRWTPEFKASLPKYAFFPFGSGPRMCIGEPFAWMEGILILATLGQRWKLRRTGNAPEPGLSPRITLAPNGPVELQAERRA